MYLAQSLQFYPEGEGGPLYRYLLRQRMGFSSCFGLNLGRDFDILVCDWVSLLNETIECAVWHIRTFCSPIIIGADFSDQV